MTQIVTGRSDHDNTQCESRSSQKGSEKCSGGSGGGGAKKKEGHMKYK